MKSFIKVFVFILPAILFTQCEWFGEDEPDPNDPVNIPDTAFLNALLEIGVDTDGDGFISYGEAEVVTNLNISDPLNSREGISDMKGIEAFVNLDTLNCSYRVNFQELNLSNNTKLKSLKCEGGVFTAFKKGADGVLLLTCHEGNCHSERGNIYAKGEVKKITDILSQAGFEKERLVLKSLASNMGMEFAKMVNSFEKKIVELGPSRLSI